MPGFGAERRRETIRKRRLTCPVLLASMANWVYNGIEALIEATLEADGRVVLYGICFYRRPLAEWEA
jgi:hypothetical protein